MPSIIEIIKNRKSCRSYAEREPEPEKIAVLEGFMAENNRGFFGSDIKFKLIKFNETPKEALKELGAYSIIKGAKLFIAGIVKKQGRYLEDYGYCMEKNILKAAGLGLATCWLGATFNRGGFSENMRAGDGEVVPAVTPVGYAAEKRRLAENVMRAAIGADSRKPVEEIYFAGSFGNPARPQDVIKEAMNCVRLAPSASNKQPWRVLDETRRQSGAAEVRFLHFFLERDKGYIYPEGQNIDMGIAMCHFEYACLELGAGGRWVVEKPSCDPGGREYIASWFFL